MMKLVEDWRRVLSVSISLWAQVISLVLFVGGEAVYGLTGIELNPYALGIAAVGFGILGIVSRPIRQPRSVIVNWLMILGLSAAIIAGSFSLAGAETADERYRAQEPVTMQILLPLLEHFEDVRLVAYRDPIGIPTICAGITAGVRMGMRKTAAECRELLRVEAKSHRDQLRPFYTADTILTRLPPTRDAAFASLAYNYGPQRTGATTAMRRLNAGQIVGACDALTWINKAGGRVVRGLAIRRGVERDYCLI